MEREFLEKQGLNADQISAIMAQYGKDVNGIKSDYDAKVSDLSGKVEGLNGQVSERDKQIKELGAAAKDNADWKAKFDDAQKTIAENDKAMKAKLLDQKKDFTIQQALTKAGAYNNKAVMAIMDMDQISVDDKGNILHVDDAIKAAQEAFPQGFKSQEEPKPAPHVVSGGNNSSETEKDPHEMGLDEMQELYTKDPAKYHRIFGQLGERYGNN